MARSLGVDWANLASNLYQNKMLAQQTAQGEVMLAQMEQQLAVQHMQEMRHQNIVEKRKLVVKLEDIASRAGEVSEDFPEYSLMMLEMALGLINDAGLREDDFEEIGDMKSARDMNKSMKAAKLNIEGEMSQDQISDCRKMKVFLLIEDDEMETLAECCRINEEWSKKSAQFEELSTLHKRRNGWRKWPFMIAGSILAFLVLGVMGALLAGDCVAYDSENPDLCVEWENDSLYDQILGLAFLSLFLGWIPGYFWSNKYVKQWIPLDEEHQRVMSVESTYLALSEKHGSSSSNEINERRAKLVKWVEELTPDNEANLLIV